MPSLAKWIEECLLATGTYVLNLRFKRWNANKQYPCLFTGGASNAKPYVPKSCCVLDSKGQISDADLRKCQTTTNGPPARRTGDQYAGQVNTALRYRVRFVISFFIHSLPFCSLGLLPDKKEWEYEKTFLIAMCWIQLLKRDLCVGAKLIKQLKLPCDFGGDNGF